MENSNNDTHICNGIFEEYNEENYIKVPPLFLTGRYNNSIIKNIETKFVEGKNETNYDITSYWTDLIVITLHNPKAGNTSLEFNGLIFNIKGANKFFFPSRFLRFSDKRIHTNSDFTVDFIEFTFPFYFGDLIPIIGEIDGVKFRYQGGVCSFNMDCSAFHIENLMINKKIFEREIQPLLDNDVLEFRPDLVGYLPWKN